MSPRYRALHLMVLFLVTAALSAFGQSTVIKTMTLDVSNYCCWDPSYCAGWTGGYATIVQFTDPLPPMSKLRSASLSWRTGNDHSYSWQGIPNVAMNLDGTLLGAFDITNYAACFPSGGQDWVFGSQDYPNGFPGYAYGSNGQNAISITITGANAAVLWGDHRTLSLTYEAPAPVEFSVTDSAPEGDRRVIISNLEPGYAYPHFQSLGGKDSEVPMFARARGQNGQYAAGLTVYLHVTDPEDTAAYMNLPPPNKLAHVLDNNGPLPTLEGSAISAYPNTVGVYQATSGANGQIDFTLKLQSGTAAGDNYKVEASFDPTFPTGESWKSGTLTAWKRVFVAKHRMLRNGIFLTADARAGASTIRVRDNHYRGNQSNSRTRAGDRIILVHAPAVDRRNALNGWYSEEHDVASVATAAGGGYLVTLGTKNGNTISPQPLSHDFGLDLSAPGIPQLADAIARLSGATFSSADYFDAMDDLVTNSVFPEAFTEYYVLPLTGFASVPLPYYGTSYQPDLETFGEKWASTVEPTPNHQLLFIADSDRSPSPDAGVTITVVPGKTSSWVFRGTIETQVSTSGSIYFHMNPDLWAEKTAAHELAHEWQTNAIWGLEDHCPSTTAVYDVPTVYCLLAANDPQTSATQRANGIARFHLLPVPGSPGAWHSEYLQIRKEPDPFMP